MNRPGTTRQVVCTAPKRRVAVADGWHDDPEAVNVGKLLKADLLVLHFEPDRIGLLLAATDLGVDGLRFELGLELGCDFLRQAPVAIPKHIKPRHERFIARGVQPAEESSSNSSRIS